VRADFSQHGKIRTLIIGFGNPLRGDDAFGWRAAEFIEAIPEIGGDPTVRIETVHQLNPELAEEIAAAKRVIFLDASAPVEKLPAGLVRCEEIKADAGLPEALGHRCTPANTLAYAAALFDAKPRAFVASVMARSFEYGAPLSPEVEAAIPAVARWVAGHLGSREAAG